MPDNPILDAPRHPILGVGVTAQTFDQALDTLTAWTGEPTRRYVCTCTAYTIMCSREQPIVADALAHAAMVTADGMPLVWLQRRAGFAAERVYGPDLMLRLCGSVPERRHVFFGGLPGIAERLADRLQSRLPALNVVDAFAPPQHQIGDAPLPEVVARLNASAPEVIWVGLGSPKQDWWMAAYRPLLSAPLLIGVGAAFDFLSGAKPQAPVWIQRSGFEWLYRLSREPRRLARRYAVYNTRFVIALTRERSGKKHKKQR